MWLLQEAQELYPIHGTMATDVGSHDVRVWAKANNDSVFHRINLNISDEWIEQSSSFQTPIRGITWMHAVDSNIVGQLSEWY